MDDDKTAAPVPGLAGKVAVVTGGGSGIGAATAKLLAGSGVRVLVGDVNVAGCEQAVADINADRGTAIFQRCDVTTERDTAAFAERAVTSFGSLQLSANIAGVPQEFSPLTDTKLEDFERNYLVNQPGMFLSLRAELSAMLEVAGGAIVNVASIAALRAFDGLSGYVSSKHAALGLSRTAASEHANRGIRVNCVAPGATATPTLLGTGLPNWKRSPLHNRCADWLAQKRSPTSSGSCSRTGRPTSPASSSPSTERAWLEADNTIELKPHS